MAMAQHPEEKPQRKPIRQTITVDRSRLGIRTGPILHNIEMIEASVAEGLAEALDDALGLLASIVHSETVSGETGRVTKARAVLRVALEAYSGDST